MLSVCWVAWVATERTQGCLQRAICVENRGFPRILAEMEAMAGLNEVLNWSIYKYNVCMACVKICISICGILLVYMSWVINIQL